MCTLRIVWTLVGLAVFTLAAGCQPARNLKLEDNLKSVRSILVVPVVNASTKVNASDYFLSTVSIPIAENGFYVYPVNMVKRLLEDNGLEDVNLVHSADPKRLGAMFGADTILYIQIQKWESKYVLIKTFTTVQLTYTLKNASTGETLWQHVQIAQSQSGGGSSGNIIADLASAAIQAAMAKALEDSQCYNLACQANLMAMAYPGHGLPAGPYKKKEK